MVLQREVHSYNQRPCSIYWVILRNACVYSKISSHVCTLGLLLTSQTEHTKSLNKNMAPFFFANAIISICLSQCSFKLQMFKMSKGSFWRRHESRLSLVFQLILYHFSFIKINLFPPPQAFANLITDIMVLN